MKKQSGALEPSYGFVGFETVCQPLKLSRSSCMMTSIWFPRNEKDGRSMKSYSQHSFIKPYTCIHREKKYNLFCKEIKRSACSKIKIPWQGSQEGLEASSYSLEYLPGVMKLMESARYVQSAA